MELPEQEKEWEAIKTTAEKARLRYARALIGTSDKETMLEDFLLKYAEAGEFEGNEKLGGVFGLLPPTPKRFRKFEAAMQTGRIRKKGDPAKQFMPDNTLTDRACWILVCFWDRELPLESGPLPPLAVWSYGAIAELFEAFRFEGNWTDDKKSTTVRSRVRHYGLHLSQTILVDGITIQWTGDHLDGLDRQVSGYKLKTCRKTRKRQAES